MLWGQFVTHDIDLSLKDDICSTCKKNEVDSCFPIMPAKNDKTFRKSECVPFTRSHRQCGTGVTNPREQMNGLTAFVDASMVYGSTKEKAEQLRDYTEDKGLLKVGSPVESDGDTIKYLLPTATESQKVDCLRQWNDTTDVECAFTGDTRANEHLSLTAIHTIWMREHNRLAKELRYLNPHWNGNRTYQEARKIIGALIQDITYKHWLPINLSNVGMNWTGEYRGYDPTIDASATNAFATAAFRFGHNRINSDVYRLYHHSDVESFQTARGALKLSGAAFCPYRIKYEGGIDPILRGGFATPLKDVSPGNVLSVQITNHLFDLAIGGTVPHDLASMDIQRGRDHGLPGYNDFRELCSDLFPESDVYQTRIADTFDDIAHEISDPDTRSALEKLYGHPGNIDLIVAGMLEDPLAGGLVGPTDACLIAEQMKRIRDGDRYVIGVSICA